uniref:CCG-binding protein 1 n=1 Tax=Kalanchoe fedtschenkoi TaxID=63787 RepID=A0A7N0T1T3_KALFE
MVRLMALTPSSTYPHGLFEAKGLHLHNPGAGAKLASTVSCSARNDAYIPKLEPFSRSKFDRVISEPPLIEKSENELADYCSTLEGDPSYSCWRAYFELKDLERESPKQEVERIILQAGGVRSLIGCLHAISTFHKSKSLSNSATGTEAMAAAEQKPLPVLDGVPKSAAEIEEEESARMPDSPFTRLLRVMGSFPAWYSPAPDHQSA